MTYMLIIWSLDYLQQRLSALDPSDGRICRVAASQGRSIGTVGAENVIQFPDQGFLTSSCKQCGKSRPIAWEMAFQA